jgi:hypothetical protein
MENKINIAELLRDCPTGMELDCALFEGVYLEEIIDDDDLDCPVLIKTKEGETWNLTSTGCWDDSPSAKCVIFPKGKTTWEGFVPPYEFKNGDVIVKNNFIAIISHIEPNGRIWYHCWYNTKYEECKIKTDSGIGRINDGDEIHFATKEEKEQLFKVIEDNGYNWNEKTNTLEKLIEPIFKKGDMVRVKNGVSEPRMIDDVCDRFYTLVPIGSIDFTDQHNWELVPNKFNINTLKPFESRVLVRDYSYEPWRVSFWGCLLDNEQGFKYDTIRGLYKQCIPYEGNEHLLGRMEDCADFYKNWE